VHEETALGAMGVANDCVRARAGVLATIPSRRESVLGQGYNAHRCPIETGTKLGSMKFFHAGGMGEVYRARDTRLDRNVTIKILHGHLADDPLLKQHLEREAKAVSKFSHPNICTCTILVNTISSAI
jgi:hypothetical protein